MRLGQFKNVEDAANAYREAALKYHGDFSKF
jgi:DnaJ-class molecular chaperone